jgi:hypothetical protein
MKKSGWLREEGTSVVCSRPVVDDGTQADGDCVEVGCRGKVEILEVISACVWGPAVCGKSW